MQDAKKASTSPDVVEISTATEERVKKKPGIKRPAASGVKRPASHVTEKQPYLKM